MFCKKCGKQLKDGVQFCQYCGQKVTEVSAFVPKEEPEPNQPEREQLDAKTPVTSERSVSASKPLNRAGIPRSVMLTAAAVGIIAAAGILIWSVGSAKSGRNQELEETSGVLAEKEEEDVKPPAETEKEKILEPEDSGKPDEATVQESTKAEEELLEEDVEGSVNDPEPLEEEVFTEEESPYILPDSDSMYLTRADLEGFTQYECRLARNELYARHGRKFNAADLQNYFNNCEWYTGRIEPEDFHDETMLNAYELANRDLIVQYEKDMGYQ